MTDIQQSAYPLLTIWFPLLQYRPDLHPEPRKPLHHIRLILAALPSDIFKCVEVLHQHWVAGN
jgi:hypothetical protein